MRLHWIVGMLCVVFASSALFAAEDKPAADSSADKPAAASSDAKPEKKSNARMTQPWSKMSTLSDEQKEKIRAIHAKANDDVKGGRWYLLRRPRPGTYHDQRFRPWANDLVSGISLGRRSIHPPFPPLQNHLCCGPNFDLNIAAVPDPTQ